MVGNTLAGRFAAVWPVVKGMVGGKAALIRQMMFSFYHCHHIVVYSLTCTQETKEKRFRRQCPVLVKTALGTPILTILVTRWTRSCRHCLVRVVGMGSMVQLFLGDREMSLRISSSVTGSNMDTWRPSNLKKWWWRRKCYSYIAWRRKCS